MKQLSDDPCLFTLLCLVVEVDVNIYTLFRVNQELYTSWGKEYSEKEGHWLKA